MKPVKFAKTACILAAAMLAAACSRSPEKSAFAPTESSLYITGEGTVTSADIESYTNDYYTEEELKASVEEALSGFGEGVTLNSVSLKDGTSSLLLDFAAPADYVKFASMFPDEESSVRVTALEISDVSTAASGGWLSDKTFKTADGKEASADDVKKQTKLHVALVEGEALIQTDGAVQYVSDGVSVVGTSQVKTSPDGTSCIIFK